MDPKTRRLKRYLRDIRALLESGFSPETAFGATRGIALSAGQCAAAAKVVRDLIGGEYVSARVAGQSHWFNRIVVNGLVIDVDLTGDQFGRPSVQIAPAGALYEDTRDRQPQEMNEETIARADRLAARIEAIADGKTLKKLPAREFLEVG